MCIPHTLAFSRPRPPSSHLDNSFSLYVVHPSSQASLPRLDPLEGTPCTGFFPVGQSCITSRSTLIKEVSPERVLCTFPLDDPISLSHHFFCLEHISSLSLQRCCQCFFSSSPLCRYSMYAPVSEGFLTFPHSPIPRRD